MEMTASTLPPRSGRASVEAPNMSLPRSRAMAQRARDASQPISRAPASWELGHWGAK